MTTLAENPGRADQATAQVLHEVAIERACQDRDHPGRENFNFRIAFDVLMEEVGEVARERLNGYVAKTTEDAVAARARCREELVQVAAVAVRYVEMIDAEIAANEKAMRTDYPSMMGEVQR